jgi:hypothetical protein
MKKKSLSIYNSRKKKISAGKKLIKKKKSISKRRIKRSIKKKSIIDGFIQTSRLTFTSDCNSALVLDFFGDKILRSFEVNFNNFYFTYSYNSTAIQLKTNYLEDSTYSNILYNLSIFDKKSCLKLVSFMLEHLKRSKTSRTCGENKLIALENVSNLYKDLNSYKYDF